MKEKKCIFKNAVIATALRLIARAAIACPRDVNRGEDFSFSIGVLNTKYSVALCRSNDELKRMKGGERVDNIKYAEIYIKNASSALKMFTGRISPRNAYAKNFFIVSGDYTAALDALVVMENVEAYLLLRRIAERLLQQKVNCGGKFKFYMRFIFGRRG